MKKPAKYNPFRPPSRHPEQHPGGEFGVSNVDTLFTRQGNLGQPSVRKGAARDTGRGTAPANYKPPAS